MTTDTKYPDIEVQLSGQDGNAFAIIGAVVDGIRRAHGDGQTFETREEARIAATEYQTEAMESDSYDALLQHAMRTVRVR